MPSLPFKKRTHNKHFEAGKENSQATTALKRLQERLDKEMQLSRRDMPGIAKFWWEECLQPMQWRRYRASMYHEYTFIPVHYHNYTPKQVLQYGQEGEHYAVGLVPGLYELVVKHGTFVMYKKLPLGCYLHNYVAPELVIPAEARNQKHRPNRKRPALQESTRAGKTGNQHRPSTTPELAVRRVRANNEKPSPPSHHQEGTHKSGTFVESSNQQTCKPKRDLKVADPEKKENDDEARREATAPKKMIAVTKNKNVAVAPPPPMMAGGGSPVCHQGRAKRRKLANKTNQDAPPPTTSPTKACGGVPRFRPGQECHATFTANSTGTRPTLAKAGSDEPAKRRHRKYAAKLCEFAVATDNTVSTHSAGARSFAAVAGTRKPTESSKQEEHAKQVAVTTSNRRTTAPPATAPTRGAGPVLAYHIGYECAAKHGELAVPTNNAGARPPTPVSDSGEPPETSHQQHAKHVAITTNKRRIAAPSTTARARGADPLLAYHPGYAYAAKHGELAVPTNNYRAGALPPITFTSAKPGSEPAHRSYQEQAAKPPEPTITTDNAGSRYANNSSSTKTGTGEPVYGFRSRQDQAVGNHPELAGTGEPVSRLRRERAAVIRREETQEKPCPGGAGDDVPPSTAVTANDYVAPVMGLARSTTTNSCVPPSDSEKRKTYFHNGFAHKDHATRPYYKRQRLVLVDDKTATANISVARTKAQPSVAAPSNRHATRSDASVRPSPGASVKEHRASPRNDEPRDADEYAEPREAAERRCASPMLVVVKEEEEEYPNEMIPSLPTGSSFFDAWLCVNRTFRHLSEADQSSIRYLVSSLSTEPTPCPSGAHDLASLTRLILEHFDNFSGPEKHGFKHLVQHLH